MYICVRACVRACVCVFFFFLSSCPRPCQQRALFDSSSCDKNVPLDPGPRLDHNHTPVLAKNTSRLHHPSPIFIPCWTPRPGSPTAGPPRISHYKAPHLRTPHTKVPRSRNSGIPQ